MGQMVKDMQDTLAVLRACKLSALSASALGTSALRGGMRMHKHCTWSATWSACALGTSALRGHEDAQAQCTHACTAICCQLIKIKLSSISKQRHGHPVNSRAHTHTHTCGVTHDQLPPHSPLLGAASQHVTSQHLHCAPSMLPPATATKQQAEKPPAHQ